MRYLLLFVLTLTLAIAEAQDTLQVTEVQKTFSKGQHTGFSVYIPQAKQKDVTSDWKKYQREKNKSDYNEVKGEYILSKTIIPEISSDSIIVYSIVSAGTTQINLTAFVTGNDSVFYNSSINPNISGKINTYIRNFAVHQYRKAVNDELTLEQKTLKSIEEDIESLEKDNEKMEKKIKNNERDINNLESEIKSNLNEQEINSKAIYHQQQVIATFLEKSDLKSQEEDKLKDLEKIKKKLVKQNNGFHNDIDDLEADNKSLKKKIAVNEDETIPLKKSDKDKQRLKIANVEVKLKGIQ
jgi:low affinity Fe/Cu permease